MADAVAATGEFAAHVAKAVPEGFFEAQAELFRNAGDPDEDVRGGVLVLGRLCLVVHSIRRS